jgi:1-deoxy-D-xylulose-5-phosphate reductoisomerase
VREYPERFSIVGMVANRDASKLLSCASTVDCAHLVLADPTNVERAVYKNESPPNLRYGPDAVRELVTASHVDVVLAAASGIAGLQSVIWALEGRKTVALANKESVVAGAALVAQALSKYGGAVIPVDSEHASLFALLRRTHPAEVRRIVLTASGGPFLRYTSEQLRAVTREQAVQHPRWAMGAKISVDSATLMNKALEVIEAVHLFGIAPEHVEVLIHPQSLVHGMLELHDGSTLLHAAPTTMKLPIAWALSHPHQFYCRDSGLQVMGNGPLEFEPVDVTRFPAIELARTALKGGAAHCIALNAANEQAVELFLAGGLPFIDIVPIVARAVDEVREGAPESLEEVFYLDQATRRRVKEWCAAV